MSVPRVCSLSRSLLSRGSSSRIASSVFLKSVAITPRHFTSSSLVSQAVTHEQSANFQSQTAFPTVPDEVRRKNARSVVIQMVPKSAVKSDVEILFKRHDLDIADMEMRLDRFAFQNDRYAFVELASEEQAQKAVRALNNSESLGEPIFVKPLKADFEWRSSRSFGEGKHQVFWNDAGVSKAILPILEGRRFRILVQTPGWADLKARINERNRVNRETVQRTFSDFGIESIGPVAVNWGDLKMRPRFLCFIDFKTKEGAEDAMRAVHDKEVEGRKVWVQSAELGERRAYHLGKVSKSGLVQLQELDLAPKQIDEARFSQQLVKRKKHEV